MYQNFLLNAVYFLLFEILFVEERMFYCDVSGMIITVFYANFGSVVNGTVDCPQKKKNRLWIRGLCLLIVIGLKTWCAEM